MDHEQPTVLDLFSGIGGFSLAFEWEGFQTIGFSEIDPYASAVLKKHWPDVPNYGDVRTVPTIACDVITGGFPCTPFSVAGKRKGKGDDRYIWPAMLNVIERCKPTYVLGENVPGIIGMELDDCLSDLENIGYSAQPFVVPAVARNADHERKRVWIVAHFNRERKLQQEGAFEIERRRSSDGVKETFPNLNSTRLQASRKYYQAARTQEGKHVLPTFTGFPGRETYPELLRDVHGIPNRVDRIKCLGNSIFPQVAQVFAKAIYQEIIKIRQE